MSKKESTPATRLAFLEGSVSRLEATVAGLKAFVDRASEAKLEAYRESIERRSISTEAA